MADDAPSPSPFGTVQVAANVPQVVEPPMVNPEAARDMGMAFLAKHEAAMANRTKDVDNIFSKQQLNVDTMSKLLDDTTASLKRAREGRSNLPLMALGAGMLSSTGDFGTQLGAGVKAMVPAIQKDRGDEEDYQYKLAQMAMRRAGVENAPLQDKLAYLRALQVGDESTIRAIESGLIKAQGQTEKAGDKAAQAASSLEEKANTHAMQTAQKQVDALGKDYFSTPQEREEELIRRYEANARSLKVPEEAIKRFSEGMRSQIDPTKAKGMFVTPGDKPEDDAKRKELGLPPKPVGYRYDAIANPTQRKAQFDTELSDWNKDTKEWDKVQSQQMSLLKNFDEMDMALTRNPNVTGPKGGVNPNKWFQNISPDAQKMQSLFDRNQIHDVPQGQGAISDFERKLFASAAPGMGNLASVNKDLIAIQRDIIKDQIAKRAFAENYFGHYKTTQGLTTAWDRYITSGAGAAAITDPDTGRLIKNPHRMTWQEFFSKEGGAAPPAARAQGGRFAKGGVVHLGEEWSD